MSEYGYVLERICKIMDNIEKDLHSIDVSLGKIVVQNEKNEPKNDFKIVPDRDILGGYVVTNNECESKISKYQAQMVEKVVSDMHAYMNKEEKQ